MEKWFNVGKIVNTHGLQGELRVLSKTDFPEKRYKRGNTLYVFMPGDQEGTPVTIEKHRQHKSFDLLTLKDYENINKAEALKGGILKIRESQLGQLEENEYFFHEIIGCSVKTLEEEEIGTVKEILTPGANDVWVVKGKAGKEHYIPYIEDVVKKVDIANKVIFIEPMEGLLS
ncbi:ribosome maturation factor RimM [Bacillus ectoiniformans]|uniref:ribosome maturation factor RimM n=1 Tax=Bacillus ectoiniformans TaxID=1494429 RepID=UPI0019560733|nr:ribosome maturation factor RimM [Bacillus ectoiniformans]